MLISFEDIDLPGGGPAVGALPKATVLQAWAKEKGLLLLDMSQSQPFHDRPLAKLADVRLFQWRSLVRPT